LLTVAHPALPIKQPCSPFQTETDFVQVRIQVKQPAAVRKQCDETLLQRIKQLRYGTMISEKIRATANIS
jgi:hypothetical protein